MTFTINSKQLISTLSILAKAIGSNPVLPILENFLFSIKGETLTLRTTDLERTIVAVLELESIKGKGKEKTDIDICIPAKILLETLKGIANQSVTFDINKKNHSIQVQAFEGVYRMAGEDGEDFPKAIHADGMETLPFDKAQIMPCLEKAATCVSTDELRPAMTGVSIRLDANGIEIAGTDAHRLYRAKLKGTYKQEFDCILPGRAVAMLKTAAAFSDEITVKANKSNIMFSFGNIEFYCRLIDAKYPDYNAVIPKENNNKMTVDRLSLIPSLKRVGNFANKTTNQIIMEINGELGLASKDLDFSLAAEEKIECSHEGEKLTIGVNYQLMIGVLGQIDSNEVLFSMEAANRAILLQGDQEEGREDLFLLMPVMLAE